MKVKEVERIWVCMEGDWEVDLFIEGVDVKMGKFMEMRMEN